MLAEILSPATSHDATQDTCQGGPESDPGTWGRFFIKGVLESEPRTRVVWPQAV